MPRFTLLGNLTHDGTSYKRGAVVEGSLFTPDQVKSLTGAGVIEELVEVSEVAAAPAPLVEQPVALDSATQPQATVQTQPPVVPPPSPTPEQLSKVEQKIVQDLAALEQASVEQSVPPSQPLQLS